MNAGVRGIILIVAIVGLAALATYYFASTGQWGRAIVIGGFSGIALVDWWKQQKLGPEQARVADRFLVALGFIVGSTIPYGGW